MSLTPEILSELEAIGIIGAADHPWRRTVSRGSDGGEMAVSARDNVAARRIDA